jgi:hypothetical protein
VWQGRDERGQQAASGAYFYRMEVPDRFATGRKMLLLPAGFSQLPSLDRWLRERGDDWSQLPTELIGVDHTEVGLTPGLGANRAAFEAGQFWVDLYILGHYSSDSLAFQGQVTRLQKLLAAFDPAAGRPVQVLLNQLQPAAPTQLAQLGSALEQLAQSHSEEAILHYQLATWLQSLKAAALAARRRTVPLGSVLDLTADAATARHFETALRAAATEEILLTHLNQLASLLEADPRTMRAVITILAEIEGFETRRRNH